MDCAIEGVESGGTDGAGGEHIVTSVCSSRVHSAACCEQLQSGRPGVWSTHSRTARQNQTTQDAGLLTITLASSVSVSLFVYCAQLVGTDVRAKTVSQVMSFY